MISIRGLLDIFIVIFLITYISKWAYTYPLENRDISVNDNTKSNAESDTNSFNVNFKSNSDPEEKNNSFLIKQHGPALGAIGTAIAPIVGAVVGPLLINIANGITNGITSGLVTGYEPLDYPGYFGHSYDAYLVNVDGDSEPYLLLSHSDPTPPKFPAHHHKYGPYYGGLNGHRVVTHDENDDTFDHSEEKDNDEDDEKRFGNEDRNELIYRFPIEAPPTTTMTSYQVLDVDKRKRRTTMTSTMENQKKIT